MGAGLLPVTIHKGKILYLLGREHEDKKWSDFGGGREGRESHFETALREGCEELNGFFGCKSHLKKYVKENMLLQVNKNGFTSYVFYVPYDDKLPAYFENNFKLMKQRLPQHVCKGGLFEKDKVGWFTSYHARKNMSNVRPFYRVVLSEVLKHNNVIKKILL